MKENKRLSTNAKLMGARFEKMIVCVTQSFVKPKTNDAFIVIAILWFVACSFCIIMTMMSFAVAPAILAGTCGYCGIQFLKMGDVPE